MAQQDAWNRGDIESFMRGYEESDSIAFVGAKGVNRGYRSILERYRKSYPNKAAMGTLKFTVLETIMLGGAHAKMIGRFELTRDAAGGGNASGYFTLIFRKTASGWRIIHDHTS